MKMINNKTDEMKWVVEIRRHNGDIERHDFYNLGAARDYAKGYRDSATQSDLNNIKEMFVYQIFDAYTVTEQQGNLQ